MKSVFLIAEIDEDGDNDHDDDESLKFPISKADSKADVSQTHMKQNTSRCGLLLNFRCA